MFIFCLTSAYIKTDEGKSELENLLHSIGKEENPQAIKRLYELTSSAVYSFALSILKNTHDAEDVLQDLYVTVYHSACSYKKGNPMAWMLTVTKNLCLMKIRSRSKFADIPEEDWNKIPLPEDTVSPEDKILIKTCLEKLTDEERQIVILHAVSEIKHREIANLLDLPIATVLSKYRRALKKLQKMIGE